MKRLISLTMAFASVLCGNAQNLLINGGFEFGAVGWTFTGGLSILGPPGSPSLGLGGTNIASIGGGNIPDSTLSQSFAAAPDTAYLLTLATGANGDNYPGRVAVMRVDVLAPDNSVLASQSFTNVSPGPLAGSTGFVKRAISFTTPTNSNFATVRITDISANGGESVDVMVDDVRVFTTQIAGPVINPANGHIYYLLPQTNWVASEEQAQSLGGHLVTIDDAAEQLWVYSTFSAWGGIDRALLIGPNDRQLEGSFVWANGAPVTYANWNLGEPNDGNSVHLENAVHMLAPNQNAPGKWNDFAESETSIGAGPTFAPFHGVVEIDPLHFEVSLPFLLDAINSSNVTPRKLRPLAADVRQATRALQRLNTKVQKRIAPADAALAAQIQAYINVLLGVPSE